MSIIYFIPVFISFFGVLLVVLLVTAMFTTPLIILAGIGAAFLSVKVVKILQAKNSNNHIIESLVVNAFVLLGVLIWLLFNVSLTSENVFVQRDPAIYNVTARHLVDHSAVTVKDRYPGSEDAGVSNDSAGFAESIRSKDELSPQGLHMLPALLASAGRVLGVENISKLAPVLGAAAILAIYNLLLFFVKPKWALLSAILFSVSLPLVYFSRDTYTEPLSAMLVLTSIMLFMYALEESNRVLNVASGIVAGSIVLTRADGLLVGLCILFSIVVLQVINISKSKESLRLNKTFNEFNYGFVPVALLGWLDMSMLSSVYYSSHGEDLRLQFLLLAILSGLNIVLFNKKLRLLLIKFHKNIKSKISTKLIRRIIFSLAILVLIFLASRPLWFIGRDYSLPSVITRYVEGNQALEGLDVDGNRNYAELTMNWMMWYMGTFTALLALIGTIISLYLSIIKNNTFLLVITILFVLPTIVFMMLVGITPDHLWASRRFLPITFPAIIFFAVISISKFYELKQIRLLRLFLISIICILTITSTYGVTNKFIGTQTYEDQFSQVQEVCSELGDDYMVLWVGQKGWNSIQTVRSYCGIDAYRIEDPTKNNLVKFYEFARRYKKVPVLIATGLDYQEINVESKKNLVEISRNNYKTIPGRLAGLPHAAKDNSMSILIGNITQKGTIVAPLNY